MTGDRVMIMSTLGEGGGEWGLLTDGDKGGGGVAKISQILMTQ